MGACCAAPTDPVDRKVQSDLEQAKLKYELEIKLLLLGAGGSGKSTLFKQLEYIHGEGFPPKKRQLFQRQIHEQLIESMKQLISRCEEYYESDPELYAKYQLYDYSLDDEPSVSHKPSNPNPTDDAGDENADIGDEFDVREAVESILSIRNNQRLTDHVIANLSSLWKHKVIQEMYSIRNEICVPDSTAYFFKDLKRITAKDYVPTDKDLLMVRYRTTGMHEKAFEIEGNTFHICDVGGQRNERRKWIHFFSNVTSVIFVASLSCYDEITFDEDANAMDITLQIYDEQVNSEWFKDIPFILFLNKSDLFVDRINKTPITVAPCLSAYKGPSNDPVPALTYIKKVFDRTNKNQGRTVYTHVTCATDRDQIQKVFEDVQTTIINWSLERAGLS